MVQNEESLSNAKAENQKVFDFKVDGSLG